MTEALYLRDSYLREFDGTVTAAEGGAVALDRTALYPGGGGLPPDLGVLRWMAPGSSEMRDGVSSFEPNAVGYDLVRASRWKKVLEPEIVSCINACMSTELEMFGYLEPGEAPSLNAELIQRVVSLPRITEILPKWSIDLPTLAGDYGAELMRTQLLENGVRGSGHLADRLLRECFLTDRIAEGLLAFRRGRSAGTDFRPFDRLVRI